MTQPQQYDDPMGEARQQILQGLATAATVLEAGARWAAVGIQNKAAEKEREAGRDQAAAAAQQQAERLANRVRADREKMAASLDGEWLTTKATFSEAAAVWRTATLHAVNGDPVAQKAAGFAADRLRQLHPDLMDAYDRHRAAGMPVHEAMRTAASSVWETEARNYRPPQSNGQPHGMGERTPIGKDGPAALPAGGWRVINDLDAAVRAEAGQLMEHVSVEALDELQRSWRAAGKAPAADAVGLLKQYTTQEMAAGRLQPVVADAMAAHLDGVAAHNRREGVQAAGAADNPNTAVDEHTEGQVASVVNDDTADHDNAAAATVRGSATAPARPTWAAAFPKLTVGAVPAAVASKQPANAVVAGQTRGRAR